MSTPTSPSVVPPSVAVRPLRWWRLFWGVLLALGVPLIAQLRLLVPIEQTILFIVPAMAAAALVAWRVGGKLWLFAAWGLLAGWMLVAVAQAGASTFDAISRGWVLVLAAAFGLVSIVNPRAPFFPRALAATGITFAFAALMVVARRDAGGNAERLVAGEFGRRLDAVTAEFEARSRSPEVRSFGERYPGAAAMIEQGQRQLATVASFAIALFPALLALESLALLALVWTLFHRTSRTRIGPPLAYLCEFRFNDQLIWGVVLGVTLLVLPGMDELRSAGLNLTVFFGALYALRGLGIISWFLAPGRPAPVLLVLAAILAGPVVGIFSVGLGLADTWIDWRGRLKPAT